MLPKTLIMQTIKGWVNPRWNKIMKKSSQPHQMPENTPLQTEQSELSQVWKGLCLGIQIIS